MKVSKAIELLREIAHGETSSQTPDSIDALCLGIEALKRVQSQRRPTASIIFHPLPGETQKDDTT